MSLEGKVAIVTGASRGIGKQIALKLGELGAKVVVNYASTRAKADEVVKELEQMGCEALAVGADISRVGEVEKLFGDTLARFGHVDILVNNAGIMNTVLLQDVTEDVFDRHFELNVKGTYFACQMAFRHMREGGRIINFSTSVAGGMFPGYSVYAATKGAVEQITRQLAKEFGPKGITINCIAPGPVMTELFTTGKSEDQITAIAKMNAFQRIGEPEDIADTVAFLAGPESRWVTGQTLRVNGGYV